MSPTPRRLWIRTSRRDESIALQCSVTGCLRIVVSGIGMRREEGKERSPSSSDAKSDRASVAAIAPTVAVADEEYDGTREVTER
jgi:hypothetical protein